MGGNPESSVVLGINEKDNIGYNYKHGYNVKINLEASAKYYEYAAQFSTKSLDDGFNYTPTNVKLSLD